MEKINDRSKKKWTLEDKHQYLIGSEKTALKAQNKNIYFLRRAKVTSALTILQFVSGA